MTTAKKKTKKVLPLRGGMPTRTPIPSGVNVLYLRVSAALAKRLRALAAQDRRSMSQWCELALERAADVATAERVR